MAVAEMQHASDSKHCRRCGHAYEYDAIYLGHLGVYHCPNCGQRRPEPTVSARDITLHGTRSATFALHAASYGLLYLALPAARQQPFTLAFTLVVLGWVTWSADALATLANRSALPVELITDIPERPSAAIETIAYFSAAELLANVAKHSGARHATLEAVHVPGLLRVRVTDDGRGGAYPVAHGGLHGLAERVRTVDGHIDIDSPVGGPTTVTVELPQAEAHRLDGQRELITTSLHALADLAEAAT